MKNTWTFNLNIACLLYSVRPTVRDLSITVNQTVYYKPRSIYSKIYAH